MAELVDGLPKPDEITSAEEFVAALRQLRAWSDLTYRQLARRAEAAGDVMPASTTATMLARSSLPRSEIVAAFVRACGLDEAATATWVTVRNTLATTATRPKGTASAPPDVPQPVPDGLAVPAMLPADIADFTGREEHVTPLCEYLAGVRRDGRQHHAAPIAAISGMGGVGKTTLAVHVAHRLAAAYPDGRLYVNLRGAEASPLRSGDVLARFLRALGVPSQVIPADETERAELYRTRLADRRVLLVLDNAATEKQVRPLLPGTATCAVLLTSRIRLTGIEGARRVDLDVFPPATAIRLLASVTADERVTAQHAQAAQIVGLCGGLPLAVRVAGARLAARPTWQLGHLAAMLGDERRRLDQLAAGDLAVRASLALSYQGLEPEVRRLFRLLSLFDLPDFPAWFTAVVLDATLERGVEHAEALVDAQLLTAAGTDVAGQQRYRFHDLVRLFARERASLEETGESLAGALTRGFGGWLAITERMAKHIPGPCYAAIGGPAPRPSMDWLQRSPSYTDAGRWFDAERAALLSLIRQTCVLGLDDVAFDLAGCMEKYFDVRGMYSDWADTNTEVMSVCRAAGNLLGEAVMLRGLIDVTTWTTDGPDGDAMSRLRDEAFRLLGMFTELRHEQGMCDAAVMCSWALTAIGDHPAAAAHASRALHLAKRSDHPGGRIRARLALSIVSYEQGRFAAAAGGLTGALDEARALGNPRWVATVLQFSGIAHRELDDFERSQRMLHESLGISRYYGDRYTEVLTLLALARLDLRRGGPDARTTAEAAVTLSREYNMSHHLAEALAVLGEIELAEDCPARAIGHLEESVAMWRTRGWHSMQAAALTSLGRAYAHTEPSAARRAFEEAAAIFTRLGDTARLAGLLPHLPTHDTD
ncbi:NB-ARC domain-containing protein [Micromonospora sp. NBC_01655]|uniref:ATP-binding protein n=1 Tax=Micromonospora sp. NBC_01655 TaxID=2975983 RepID=UPI0022593890|nr:XRE family transcriptional regulator [Micromonospora sp. NBC_01655]MCX4471657.1 NB-ARC domain-containing protein [Micromonospora sp. NBC_01655]